MRILLPILTAAALLVAASTSPAQSSNAGAVPAAPTAAPAASAMPSATPKPRRVKKVPVQPAVSSAAAATPAPASAATPVPAAAATPAAATAGTTPAPGGKTRKPKGPDPLANVTPAPGGGPGMVWVNTKSKVYHDEKSRYYGKTKKGKYMSEADAKAAGFKATKGDE